MFHRLGQGFAIFIAGVLVASLVQVAIGAPVNTAGGPITQVKVVTDGQMLRFVEATPAEGSPGWTDVARTSITIPADWKSGLVLARFTGQLGSHQHGMDLRLLIGGVEAAPMTQAPDLYHVIFDGGEWPVAIDRSRGNLHPGTYEVKVQVNPTFLDETKTEQAWVDDWSLVAERARST